jgi:NTP pyrophosphatase (non-canonical NTP hydrolase)
MSEIEHQGAVAMTGTPSPQDRLLGLTLAALQRSHVERQEEWCPDQKPDLSFRGNELGGECGEAQNVIKKLERERHGWRGSRDTVEHLGEELADVIHCAILCAITAGIDLEPAVIAKFNSTSVKNGLSTFLTDASEVQS